MATDADWGRKLICDRKGLDDRSSQYFYKDKYYGYKETRGPSYWKNGSFYTADIIDGQTGAFINKQDLIMYCDYLEHHSGWLKSRAENYAFSGVMTYKNSSGEHNTRFVFGLGIETTAL